MTKRGREREIETRIGDVDAGCGGGELWSTDGPSHSLIKAMILRVCSLL